MKERTLNAIWSLGLQTRNFAKKIGILGRLEPMLLKLAPNIVKSPSAETEVVLPWLMKFAIPPGFSGARSYATGLYEPEMTDLTQKLFFLGSTVVDVGANLGYYTLLASLKVGHSGKVYSFEPDPTAYTYLVKNIESNNCRNVVVVQKAVCEISKIGHFMRDQGGAEGFLTQDADQTIEVQTISLDDFFEREGWPCVDFVKMDIEGGEFAALKGMKQLSDRNAKMRLLMEYNAPCLKRNSIMTKDLFNCLQELGFRTGYVIERGMKTFKVKNGLPASQATYNLLLEKE